MTYFINPEKMKTGDGQKSLDKKLSKPVGPGKKIRDGSGTDPGRVRSVPAIFSGTVREQSFVCTYSTYVFYSR
jgi:hypothetical protein